MTKLFIELQTPSIEIKVPAKDAAGTIATCTIGFKRYEAEEANLLLNRYMDVLNSLSENNLSPVLDIIKDEIIYIKKIPLKLQDNNGKLNKLNIEDTRKETSREDLWEDSEEALETIKQLLIKSSCWQLPIIRAAQKAASNMDQSELEIKN